MISLGTGGERVNGNQSGARVYVKGRVAASLNTAPTALILRRDPIRRVDHQNLDRLFPRFQFESRVALDRGEDGRPAGVLYGRVAVETEAGKIDREMVVSLETSHKARAAPAGGSA